MYVGELFLIGTDVLSFLLTYTNQKKKKKTFLLTYVKKQICAYARVCVCGKERERERERVIGLPPSSLDFIYGFHRVLAGIIAFCRRCLTFYFNHFACLFSICMCKECGVRLSPSSFECYGNFFL